HVHTVVRILFEISGFIGAAVPETRQGTTEPGQSRVAVGTDVCGIRHALISDSVIEMPRRYGMLLESRGCRHEHYVVLVGSIARGHEEWIVAAIGQRRLCKCRRNLELVIGA